ncbi:hypothetical protein LTS08_008853 [Lithohypha guttulata]|nr:hypothetical protein LTS08_008853 [Lithohypha guttulata]
MSQNYKVQYAAAYLETRLWAHHVTTFQGYARVLISCLDFQQSTSRGLDSRVLDDLASKYRQIGCLRLNFAHHVPVILAREILLQAAIQANATADDLLSLDAERWPQLMFNPTFKLPCLHGRHRTAAAATVLPESDRWWVVAIYSPGEINALSSDLRLMDVDISAELQQSLRDQTFFEIPLTAGEVFFHILRCDRDDHQQLDMWWARIRSRDEARELRRLYAHPRLNASFEKIARRIPAMASSMLAGNVGTLLRLKCDEWVMKYLTCIYDAWHSALDGDIDALDKVDANTICSLQSRSLKYCKTDREYVEKSAALLFSSLSSEQRDIILLRWAKYEHLIPSLATFFEDLKYLESVAAILRLLLKPLRKHSLCKAMRAAFQPIQGSTHQLVWEEAYAGLILFAMRYLEELRPGSLKLERSQSRISQERSAHTLYLFAQEAHQLGFRSASIEQILATHPDRLEAERTLKRARDPSFWAYDGSTFEDHVRQIMALYDKATRVSISQGNPRIVCYDEGETLGRRSGRPFWQAHAQSCGFLEFKNIKAEYPDQQGEVTPFYVRRSVYYSFFETSIEIDHHIHRLSEQTVTANPSGPDITMNSSSAQVEQHSTLNSPLRSINDLGTQLVRDPRSLYSPSVYSREMELSDPDVITIKFTEWGGSFEKRVEYHVGKEEDVKNMAELLAARFTLTASSALILDPESCLEVALKDPEHRVFLVDPNAYRR